MVTILLYVQIVPDLVYSSLLGYPFCPFEMILSFECIYAFGHTQIPRPILYYPASDLSQPGSFQWGMYPEIKIQIVGLFIIVSVVTSRLLQWIQPGNTCFEITVSYYYYQFKFNITEIFVTPQLVAFCIYISPLYKKSCFIIILICLFGLLYTIYKIVSKLQYQHY